MSTEHCADPRQTAWTIWLLAAALLAGGLRDPRLFAVGGTAVAAALWQARPPLGPALVWLPWLGWTGLSALVCLSPLSALPVLARWVAAVGFLSLAAAWREKERESWLKIFLATAAVLAAAALWTGVRAHSRTAMTGLLPPYYNYTAFVLSAAAAAAAAWAWHPRGPRGAWRAAASAVFVTAAAGVALARSRGAMLGLGVAAMVWAARRWGARALAGGAVVLAGGGVLFWSSATGRSYVLKAERLRGEARPAIWRAAARVAGESPWFGEGPGNFAAGFRRHPVPVPKAAARWALTTEYAHSEPLQAAAETGWAGFVLWLAALAAGLGALRGRVQEEPAREAATAAVAAMTAQLAVDNMLQVPGLAFLFFGALGVAGGASRERRWPRTAAAFIGTLALISWLPRQWVAADPLRAMRLFPTDAAAVEAAAYRTRGSAAQALWERAERLSPYNAVYPWRRAQIAALDGRWVDVESLSARAVALEPGFLRARALRAEASVRLGWRAQALAEVAEVMRRLQTATGAENGYERVVTDFDAADRIRLARVADAARGN